MSSIKTMVSLVLALGVWGAPSLAGTNVLTLGPGRGYDLTNRNGTSFEFVMNGSAMNTIRSILEANGYTFTSSESFTAESLTGFDAVFLGLFDPSERLTTQERSALEAFVLGGGALIYMGDNGAFSIPNNSVANIFNVTYSADNTALTATSSSNPSHPIIQGPFGAVQTYEASLNLNGFFGGISNVGPRAHAVLGTNERAVVVVIERDQLSMGSGPVVFISEANGFFDAPVGTIDRGDNITLMRNIFAFIKTNTGSGCSDDAGCSDSIFCNGEERCVDSACIPGVFPCDAGLGCNEAADTCGPCTSDDECNDLLFCNGNEVCSVGQCLPGTRPCSSDEGCHEETDTCGPCTSDDECSDQIFCNGQEVCIAGVCSPGTQPCLPDEICDESADVCSPCASDAECDDPIFCNGQEQCVNGACVAGLFPCGEGMGCKEESDTCGPCASDAECDDQLFCTGEELCAAGLCLPGMRPCLPSEGCDEEAETCGPCVDNVQCDDELFCSGIEICETDGTCSMGDDPCPGECEFCDEETGSCVGCILDLDGDGFIGTGDYGLLAGCFGDCYPEGDRCLLANFDGSADGCVGSGDFAAYSSCFEATCGDCPNCVPPDPSVGGPAVLTAGFGANIVLVALPDPSLVDTADEPPASQQVFQADTEFYVEVWAHRGDESTDGLSSVYVDLAYDPLMLSVLEVTSSTTFEVFTREQVLESEGRIARLGGSTQPGIKLVGVNPAWGRVSVVKVSFNLAGQTELMTGPSDAIFGIAATDSGDINPGHVDFGRISLIASE